MCLCRVHGVTGRKADRFSNMQLPVVGFIERYLSGNLIHYCLAWKESSHRYVFKTLTGKYIQPGFSLLTDDILDVLLLQYTYKRFKRVILLCARVCAMVDGSLFSYANSQDLLVSNKLSTMDRITHELYCRLSIGSLESD